MLSDLVLAATMATLPEMVPIQDYYPKSALRRDKSAAAVLELTVDPEGSLVECKTLTTFGDDDFAQDICKLQSKAELAAARDSKGNPVHGVLRVLVRYAIIQTEEGREIYRLEIPGYTHTVTGIRWRSGSRPPEFEEFEALVGETRYVLSSDAQIEVEAMPGVEGKSLHQSMVVQVDEDGTVSHCEGDAKFGTSRYEAYRRVACDQISEAGLKPLIVGGKAVTHVRRYEVEFTLPERESQTSPIGE